MAKKRQPRYKKFIGFIYVGIAAILIYTVGTNTYRVFEQQQKYNQLEARKSKLEDEKKALAKTIDLLSDEDYVVRYARENYIFSKEGEEVVRLPESKKK